jgi:ribulose-phosphate 3-epimerase
MMILAPSILAADLGHLADQVALAERGGAGVIHVDVMDGHFVPNLSVGPATVRALRRTTTLPLDVHLMVERPEDFVEPFAEAGAQWISVHVEAAVHLNRILDSIARQGLRPGVAINPASPLSLLEEVLPDVAFVLVMTVNPGFGGQSLLKGSLERLRRLRRLLAERGLSVQIEVDGGIDPSNVRSVVDAGADIVVAGSAVFGAGDPERGARLMLEAGR